MALSLEYWLQLSPKMKKGAPKRSRKYKKMSSIGERLGLYKETVNKYVNAAKSDSKSIEELVKMDEPELQQRFSAGNAAYSDKRFDALQRSGVLCQGVGKAACHHVPSMGRIPAETSGRLWIHSVLLPSEPAQGLGRS